MLTSRRSLLAGVGGISLGTAANALQPRQASAGEAALPVASEGGEELVAVAVNDALEGAWSARRQKTKSHEGIRCSRLLRRDQGGCRALAVGAVCGGQDRGDRQVLDRRGRSVRIRFRAQPAWDGAGISAQGRSLASY